MNNIFRFHPLERPKADGPNMLSNDERINPNIVPLEKLRAMDEDTYEDVVAVWAYIDSFAKYCNDKDWKYQIIILDNKITNDIKVDTLTNINLIEFGTAERYGLFYE